jgi:pyridoxine 5-phosphate synthase
LAYGSTEQGKVLRCYSEAASAARAAGVGVTAGHDLNLHNLAVFLREVPGIDAVSIGHALIADALEFGLASTVRKYQAEIRKAHTCA